MAIVTGDRYLEKLVKFLEEEAEPLIEGTKVLKLNPAGLHYVHLRLEALQELERLLTGAPVDYLRAYVSDLGDYRALEQLRRILRLLTSLKVVSALPPPARDPTPLALLPFSKLKVLELRRCDLSTSAAKGLLELRHTLEKIICHNSTVPECNMQNLLLKIMAGLYFPHVPQDALRHVFASRIVEIKDSPQWKKLSFVSCACNRLVLMDESLQLLPAVEVLDLSRNKFAKVDNLRRCTNLKHLDLGFNHLRTVSHFSEVSGHIVKLVLRNNALTTLRGIENLKSLEGLDVSYNLVSNFSELEVLGGLSSLESLWLDGNPLCCARWYRAQVFSIFTYPEKLKLDDKEISTKEFWKRQIIVARRQKRPSSFGFYSPAKDDAEEGGRANRKKKKVSRLASIDSEEESTYIGSDQESVSSQDEIQREKDFKSDNQDEIFDLINIVENLKKEYSFLWLQEFKQWMDPSSENYVESSNSGWGVDPQNKRGVKGKKSQRHRGESAGNALAVVERSQDESKRNASDSYEGPMDLSSTQHIGCDGTLKTTREISVPGVGQSEQPKKPSHEDTRSVKICSEILHPDSLLDEGQRPTDDVMGSFSSSGNLGSPPHYQEDVLHRRHNLVEEILQLSANSYSVASSDSMTSGSKDDFSEYEESIAEIDHLVDQRFLSRSELLKFVSGDRAYLQGENTAGHPEFSLGCQSENSCTFFGTTSLDQLQESSSSNCLIRTNDFEQGPCFNQNDDISHKRKCRAEPRKRIISFLEQSNIVSCEESSQRFGNGLDAGRIDSEKECSNRVTRSEETRETAESAAVAKEDPIQNYFRKKVADSRIQETCKLYLRCYCSMEEESSIIEREVVLLLSSEHKLYVLLVDVPYDNSGTSLSLLRWHRVEDVQDVLVGLGLQVVRIYIEGGTTYLFVTKDIEKSKELLNILQVLDSKGAKVTCSLRSLEQVQVELFEKQICGGLKLSIFQYSIVLFWSSLVGEESWLAISLFVTSRHLLLCLEDFTQFGSLPVDGFSAPYLSLDSCCSIADVSEMAIRASEGPCSTLSIKRVTSEFHPAMAREYAANDSRKTSTGSVTWKLKWFSEEGLFKFVALLKALHGQITARPLLVKSA